METKTNYDYTRRNRFSGESIELTKEEAEKHDKIFYHEALNHRLWRPAGASLTSALRASRGPKTFLKYKFIYIVNLHVYKRGPKTAYILLDLNIHSL